jgi:DNA polymerase-3 subunit gamma/tau
MLTNEAFNALLKTLEEPPPHVIFIFATTEPQKIPATIHSRCQRYGFKRVAVNEIIERLRTIASSEGIKISESGLAMIARAAEGSMRDSQSLLDQSVSYSGMEIKDEELQATLGSVAQAALLQFSSGLLARNASGLLEQIDALLEQGQDMRQFLTGVVEHLRNLLVVKIAQDPVQIIELPVSDIEAIKRQAAGVEANHLLMLFDSLSKTLDDMRWSPHQRFTLEVGLIKACHIAALQPLADVLGRIKELEIRLASGKLPPASSGSPTQTAHRINEGAASYSPPRPPEAGEGNLDDLWGRILAALRSKKPVLASFLEHGMLTDVSEKVLIIAVKGSFQKVQVEKRENLDFIEQTAGEVLGRKVQIKIQALAEAPKPEGKQKSPKTNKPNDQDPAVQDVLKVFPQGEIIERDNPAD